jgi:hypothetical protein
MRITVNIVRNQNNKPQDKLADAELHFTGGELDGLKLLGFPVWQQRNGTGRNVTFPARPFTVSGERRNFVLLRAIEDRAPRIAYGSLYSRRTPGKSAKRKPHRRKARNSWTPPTRGVHDSKRRTCKGIRGGGTFNGMGQDSNQTMPEVW